MNTLRCVGKVVNTLKCVGIGVNTELCLEGWEHCGVLGRV